MEAYRFARFSSGPSRWSSLIPFGRHMSHRGDIVSDYSAKLLDGMSMSNRAICFVSHYLSTNVEPVRFCKPEFLIPYGLFQVGPAIGLDARRPAIFSRGFPCFPDCRNFPFVRKPFRLSTRSKTVVEGRAGSIPVNRGRSPVRLRRESRDGPSPQYFDRPFSPQRKYWNQGAPGQVRSVLQ